MEPWLDSLSEDWNSEPRWSSPASSTTSKAKFGTQSSTQSKIPHLAHSLRRSSTIGSYLRPRSSRGLEKANGGLALTERSASSLNIKVSSHDSAQKARHSSLPRRASSVLSESQSSVQRHSVNSGHEPQEIPEWKQRLMNGEDVAGDGVDLFSPSKLEGMFVEPAARQDNMDLSFAEQSKPWKSLNLPQVTNTNARQSFRGSRSRVPVMEALEEVNEENVEVQIDTEHRDLGPAAVSTNMVNEGMLSGSRNRNTSNLSMSRPIKVNSRVVSRTSQDPRWRTFSGQQEIKNEIISPVTGSVKDSIRGRAVQNSVELDVDALKQKLLFNRDSRPSSRSSDREVSYMSQEKEDSFLQRDAMPEITSHSLPEDLSMGTQDLVSNAAFVNPRRGGFSHEGSFLRRKLSSSDPSGVDHSIFRSSPPPYASKSAAEINEIALEENFSSLVENEIADHESQSLRQPSSGKSPLKLFGNRDTYTNNKLMRVLSHYGQDASTQEGSLAGTDLIPNDEEREDTEFRMSQFGNGELDSFNFQDHSHQPELKLASRLEYGGQAPTLSPMLADRTKEQHPQHSEIDQPNREEGNKRLPSSPAKGRTPKRRRTLLRDEIAVEGVNVEIKVDQVASKATLVASKKRKDAKPGEDGAQANPEVLAARSILQPKPGSRKNSGLALHQQGSTSNSRTPGMAPAELTEALAEELASFAKGVSDASKDSRKPSLATRDYMEEANKVMEFIRAKGKPKTRLSGIQEPNDLSELNSDDILDLEVDDDSTKESFSRPPSRERPVRPRDDRRIAKHDPSVASRLKKYQETDDLELLASTSAVGTFNLADNNAASEAARVPVPDDSQESSPAGIRISNPKVCDVETRNRSLSDTLKKEETSSSTGSANRTLPTSSSGSSGRKGVISSGTVSIPNVVGTMTFDHDKQAWIKQQLSERLQTDHTARLTKDLTLDDDPFGGIPDLSVDEQHEAALIKDPKQISRPSTSGTIRTGSRSSSFASQSSAEPTLRHIHTQKSGPRFSPEILPRVNGETDHEESTHSVLISQQPISRSAISKHEEDLDRGLQSTEPQLSQRNHQPRVVTISFPSPVASEIPYTKGQDDFSDDTNDDDIYLPPDDSDYEDYVPTPKAETTMDKVCSLEARNISSRKQTYGGLCVSTICSRRPISPIVEMEEDEVEKEGLSLIHIQQSDESTPQKYHRHQVTAMQLNSAYKGSSILSLTPLSEFTMHQADKRADNEESFVAARPHPKALLPAHGSLALSKDELVQAITDATPDQPFWEHLHRLDLSEHRLIGLNALHEYCPHLETLTAAKNRITQLTGLPPTMRQLNLNLNILNDFTSWGHLQNLQVLDVSHNQLESLEGLSSLLHLRVLRANNNRIRDIKGIFGLDGLISLDVSHNYLSTIDFENANLEQLREILLSNNAVTSCQNLHRLPKLEFLDVAHNNLREFTAKTSMPSIKRLVMAHNDLDSLELAVFPQIEQLDLDDNLLHTLEDLSAMEQLRKLSLRAQRHSADVANAILSKPNNCIELYLSSNMFKNGQITLPDYPHYNLRHLEIAACGLHDVPEGFGDYFPNCRTLNLNFNAVSDLASTVGCVKLENLELAGNRIKRLRRTCLTLSRLPHLQNLDIRDNPLTLGFYPPMISKQNSESYTMHDQEANQDFKWLEKLDETTALKRRMLELLLAQTCKLMGRLNGMGFNHEDTLERDGLWDRLTSRGVLVKPDEARSTGRVSEPDRGFPDREDERQTQVGMISVSQNPARA